MNPYLVRHLWFVVERDGERRGLHWLELDDGMIAAGWQIVDAVRSETRPTTTSEVRTHTRDPDSLALGGVR